jgi:hypothetical protein
MIPPVKLDLDLRRCDDFMGDSDMRLSNNMAAR